MRQLASRYPRFYFPFAKSCGAKSSAVLNHSTNHTRSLTLLFWQICLIAIVTGGIAGCSNAGSSATQRKVNILAAQKYGAPYDVLPNSNNKFILCIKHEKETIPLRPIRFFVYDVQKDSIVYEREVDNGIVEWLNASQLSIKQIPGNVTGHEPPDAFTEIYDIPSGKILSR